MSVVSGSRGDVMSVAAHSRACCQHWVPLQNPAPAWGVGGTGLWHHGTAKEWGWLLGTLLPRGAPHVPCHHPDEPPSSAWG